MRRTHTAHTVSLKSSCRLCDCPSGGLFGKLTCPQLGVKGLVKRAPKKQQKIRCERHAMLPSVANPK